tara:strand:+ start:138 stop:410 length:273 start_codon:yes stop_codon:yes gene_type:complete
MEESKEKALQRSREIEIFMSKVFLTSLENRWCKENPVSFNEFLAELPEEVVDTLGWADTDILQIAPMIDSDDLSTGLYIRNITKDGLNRR